MKVIMVFYSPDNALFCCIAHRKHVYLASAKRGLENMLDVHEPPRDLRHPATNAKYIASFESIIHKMYRWAERRFSLNENCHYLAVRFKHVRLVEIVYQHEEKGGAWIRRHETSRGISGRLGRWPRTDVTEGWAFHCATSQTTPISGSHRLKTHRSTSEPRQCPQRCWQVC